MPILEQLTERSPTTLRANGVLSAEIDSVWHEVKSLIEPAIFENEFTLDEIYQKLKDREMQLWIVWDIKIICACVTQIEKGRNKKYFTIIFIGGERMGAWFEYINVLEEYAKTNGCEEIRMLCRKGFWKLLSQYGFDNPLSLFRKQLNG